MEVPCSFDGVLNFRGMGGLPTGDGRTVRRGVLFRSAHFGTTTDADRQRLKELGVRTVIDLRTETDKGFDGQNQVPDGVSSHNFPVGDIGDAGEMLSLRTIMAAGDPDLVRLHFGNGEAHDVAMQGQPLFVDHPQILAACRTAFDAALDPERRALVVHCTAGKDRTGWVCTTIGLALGVPDEALVQHYLRSNDLRPPASRTALYRHTLGDAVDLLLPVFQVHEDYLNNGLTHMRSQYGDATTYLRDAVGLSAAEQAQLQSALLV